MTTTIGTMTSYVNVKDSNNMPSDAVMEQITQKVMMRFKAEKHAEEQTREERKIRDRATISEPF